MADTFPDVGVATISSHPNSRITSSSLLTHSLDTNEWVAHESYNTTTSWFHNKQVVYASLPNWVASVVVNANTSPGALGCSPTGLFARMPPAGFLLGDYWAKCPIWSHTQHLPLLAPPPELPEEFRQSLLRCSPPQLKHCNFLAEDYRLLYGFFCCRESVVFFYSRATLVGHISSCSTALACSTETGISLILNSTRNMRSSCFSPPSYFLHLHSSVTTREKNLAKYSKLFVYACIVRFRWWNVRNSTSLLCLALSMNLVRIPW